MKMTIGKKILGGYLLQLLVLALLGSAAIYIVSNLGQAYSTFLDQDQQIIINSHAMRAGVNKSGEAFRGFLLYDRDYMIDRYREGQDETAAALAELRRLLISDADLGIIEQVESLVVDWRESQDQILEGVGTVPREQSIAAAQATVLPLREAVLEQIPEIQARAEAHLREGREHLNSRVALFHTGLIGLLCAGVVLALILSGSLSKNITSQLRQAITQLATSTAEISSMTTQVAASAAETATAVSETTTTVEEVKQTAQVSTQKARVVSDTAQKAASIAQSGQDSVEQTVDGMARIRAQMDSIAGTVVKLSEQSQAIGEIIASVNDLAEQSNLLSVNAAIEAARAGESGKGFAVVAQEVKSLADQSRQATAQVRTILSDIQRAMGAAVMATEQGTKAVESGSKQAEIAGDSIQQLAEALTDAAEAATQIAASSQQQLVGMDQVALAMENINQASAQNLSGTRQSEVAAHNLNELTARLRELIESRR